MYKAILLAPLVAGLSLSATYAEAVSIASDIGSHTGSTNDLILATDCSNRSVAFVRHQVRVDSGNAKRLSSFHLSDVVAAGCQQKNTGTYSQKYTNGFKFSFDRGHLLPANLFDYSHEAISASNNMLNIVPQMSIVNRRGGAWYETEMIVECQRNGRYINDHNGIEVFAGAIWNDSTNDFFVNSHGIETPEFLWKIVLYRSGEEVNAVSWLIPNTEPAKASDINRYLTTPRALLDMGANEALLDALPYQVIDQRAKTSPIVAANCDYS